MNNVQPSIICLFELVHLNNLLFDELVDEVVKEVDIKDALKIVHFCGTVNCRKIYTLTDEQTPKWLK